MYKTTFWMGFWLLVALATHGEVVRTEFGPVQGTLNGTVHQFLGIPYAKPPVGELRWKAPSSPAPWTGVLDATQFAPECPQKRFQQGTTNGVVVGDEDCLYLNIWSPQLGTPELPVLVFIHGGGNQQGSASDVKSGTPLYFGKNMAERGKCVVVTIQYRLGPLGFLVHPGLEPEHAQGVSGNYAVLDQILALRWVKQNIAAFGGNPQKTMIFGESAGGLNVGNLLTTPLAAGLFQRACIQSAVPVLGNYQVQKSNGVAFVEGYVSSGTDVEKMTYMRSLSVSALVENQTPPVEGGVVGLLWQAVIDGVVFRDGAANVIQSGHYNKVPLMIGSNSEEMSLGVPGTVTPAMVNALINASVPGPLRDQAAQLYPPGSSNADARESAVGILSDAQFTATTRRIARCISLNQSEPVWRYFFTHKHRPALLAALGSYHGMELFYVFNNWENATLGSGALFSPGDDAVQKAMLKYWVQFADTGNPNGVGLPAWPLSLSTSDCYLEIKATSDGSGCGLRTAKSDFWDAVVGKVPCEPQSVMRLRLLKTAPPLLEVTADIGRGYTVESSESLDGGVWNELRSIPAGAARLVEIQDEGAMGATRFYRVRTP